MSIRHLLIICLVFCVFSNGSILIFGNLTNLKAIDIIDKEGLVGEWHFDETTGTIAYDSSDNNNDMNLYGAYCGPGEFGDALYFDGVNDYAEVLNTDILESTNNMTILLWVKPWVITESISYFIITNGFGVWQREEKLGCAISTTMTNSSSSKFTFNKWEHIAATYDGSKISFYLNGELKETNIWPGTMASLGRNFVLGVFSGNYWRGNIDEIYLYNRVLTENEILRIYEEYVPKENYSACWHLDEGKGDIAFDSSGNNHDASVYDASWVTGVDGYALKFDGVNDYVELPVSATSNLSIFTITFLVKTKEAGADNTYWLNPTMFGQSVTNDSSTSFGIGVRFGEIIAWSSLDGVNDLYFYSEKTINDGVWHLICAVNNGSVIKFFVDGTYLIDKNYNLPYQLPGGAFSDNPFKIGVIRRENPGSYFSGTLDEVCIYPGVLTPEEIQTLFYEYGGPFGEIDEDEESPGFELILGIIAIIGIIIFKKKIQMN